MWLIVACPNIHSPLFLRSRNLDFELDTLLCSWKSYSLFSPAARCAETKFRLMWNKQQCGTVLTASIIENGARPSSPFLYPALWNANVKAGAQAAILYVRNIWKVAELKDRIRRLTLYSYCICPGILPPNLFDVREK